MKEDFTQAFLGFIVVFVVVWNIGSCEFEDTSSDLPNVSIIQTIEGFTIMNNEEFSLNDIRLYLNSNYKHRPNYYLKPNQSVTIPYTIFVDDNSTRFNLYLTKVESMSIKVFLEPEEADGLIQGWKSWTFP